MFFLWPEFIFIIIKYMIKYIYILFNFDSKLFIFFSILILFVCHKYNSSIYFLFAFIFNIRFVVNNDIIIY